VRGKLVGALVLCAAFAAAAASAEEVVSTGLLATYSDGNHRVVLSVPSPNFHLGPQESLHPTLAPAFSAEWSGSLSILQADEYSFEAAPAELYLDGRRVDDKAVRLSVGAVPFRIVYRRTPGVAALLVRWKSSQWSLEPIPAELFAHSTRAPAADLDVEEGRRLAEELGCIGCHATGSPVLERRFGPRLTGVGERTNVAWLAKWLADPGAFRAGAVMPSMLAADERNDVAAYLATLSSAARGKAAQPAGPKGSFSRGMSLYYEVGCGACHEQKALVLSGLGSKYQPAALAAYLEDPAKVHPAGRMPSLLLTKEETAHLAASLVRSRNPAFDEPVPVGGNIARGRSLVEARGCLACHELQDGKPVANRLRAPALPQLTSDRGCLADKPAGGVPAYRLQTDQRKALRAFVTAQKGHPDVSPAPVYGVYRRAAALRCTACHTLDHLRPTYKPIEAIPPLSGVGSKLRTSWIDGVLTDGRRVRDWLKVRMPDWNETASKGIAVGLAKAAGLAPGEGPSASKGGESTARRKRGHGLLGTNAAVGGLGCVGCHGWGTHQSLGEGGPQLIDVAPRLRYDWYVRWMRDPARIISGTTMPSFFAALPPAQGADYIDTLWAAFSAGKNLPVPEGFTSGRARLGGEAMPSPDREAIVVRWDMPEATPAAIAVGLPGGKLSYCFDAGESRLRYAWRGGFVDLSPTLLAKVDKTKQTPTAALLGEVFYRSPAFPVRVKDVDRVPEARFRGYRLLEGVPQFHYQVDGVDVYERVLASSQPPGLKREFFLPKVDTAMWLLDGRFPGDKMDIPKGAPVRFDVIVPEKGGGR
jgi:mono/diheme cytochrome c family protein